MQTTMLSYPYSLPCESYIDISATESVTSSSRSGTPSPPAKNFDRSYTPFIASPLRPEVSNTTGRFPGLTFESVPRKKSFTIDAILGLDEDSPRKDFNRTGKIEESPREKSTLSPRPYEVSPAATIFKSTVEKKAETKSRGHPAFNASHGDVERFSMPPKSASPNLKSTSNCGSSQKCMRHNSKMKRIRTIFTPEQLERLELEFERQQYMVGPERMYLASALGLSESQVKVWFQNRRIKFRKQHLEMQQARLAQLRENETTESENEQERVNHTQDISSTHWTV